MKDLNANSIHSVPPGGKLYFLSKTYFFLKNLFYQKLIFHYWFLHRYLPVYRYRPVYRFLTGLPVLAGLPVEPVDRPVRSGLKFLDRYRYRSSKFRPVPSMTPWPFHSVLTCRFLFSVFKTTWTEVLSETTSQTKRKLADRKFEEKEGSTHNAGRRCNGRYAKGRAEQYAAAK